MAILTRSQRTAWRSAIDCTLRRCFWPPNWRSSPRDQLHQKTYDAKYYEFIEFTSACSRDAMAESIVRDLAPRHAIDVGCGTGSLLEALRWRSVKVAGLEYSDIALKRCRERRLHVRKFDIAHNSLPRRLRQRDVSISFEVAEHLPAELAERFVDLLTMASNTIVLSAATPGQGGTDHVNEQPHDYWIEKMAIRRFEIDKELSLRWRAEWQDKTANWYHANVMVFRQQPSRRKAA
jgi:SAM-dependent methyltransferase